MAPWAAPLILWARFVRQRITVVARRAAFAAQEPTNFTAVRAAAAVRAIAAQST